MLQPVIPVISRLIAFGCYQHWSSHHRKLSVYSSYPGPNWKIWPLGRHRTSSISTKMSIRFLRWKNLRWNILIRQSKIFNRAFLVLRVKQGNWYGQRVRILSDNLYLNLWNMSFTNELFRT